MTLPTHLAAALADRYRLERELGAGGMATVYLAHDRRHRREVAIKVLRPDVAAAIGRDRFLREIELAAGLQHPNILGLIDSGEAGGALYYIMPFLSGDSLRDRLRRERAIPTAVAVRWIQQVASALDYAHRRGVVHRDIKPENILLQDDHATVADFGIALAATPDGQRFTEVGFSLGTPAYMSPEQVTGDSAIDGRSDQYSLACVLYELLTGAPPFAGATPQAVMVKHVTEMAPTLGAGYGALATAVERALAKAPTDRFPSMAAFGESLGGPPATLLARAAPDATIVVLPFEDASPNPDDSYFALGLTDEVISDLSKVKAIRVISRNTSMKLKGTSASLEELGRELRVRYALTGSVRRAGDHLRIVAELAETESATSVWTEKYQGTTADVFGLQEKLSREIVAALQVTLTPQESRQLVARPAEALAVFETLVVARDLLFTFDPSQLSVARGRLLAALARAGDRADLLGLLSVVQTTLAICSDVPDREGAAMAAAYATKALALDPTEAWALEARATYAYWFGRGSAEAQPWVMRALAQVSRPEFMMEVALNSAYLGLDLDGAVTLLDEAIARDPTTVKFLGDRCWMLAMAGRTERTIQECLAIARMSPAPIVSFQAAVGLHIVGRSIRETSLRAQMEGGVPSLYVDAIDAMEAATVAAPGESTALPSQAMMDLFRSYDPLAASMIAGIWAAAGRRDEAMEWMGIAIDRGVTNERWWREWFPLMAAVRHDPRFEAQLERARAIREAVQAECAAI